ncbi:MAG: hypothetical protein HGA93_06880 [Methanothrix sp.]|nr:hypothetical protein [Methanothrix sp.]
MIGIVYIILEKYILLAFPSSPKTAILWQRWLCRVESEKARPANQPNAIMPDYEI